MKNKASTKVYHPPVEKEGPLTRDDVLCPVCWSILIEPVTFPCAHSICLLCFRNTVKEASWSCPCCRVRISNWSRRVEKNGTLVNQKLWDRIQKEFPKFVIARQQGQDSQDVLAEINSEERKLATEQTVFVSPQSAKKKNSADTVAESLHELRDAAEKIRKEVEEVDAQLIRRFKVEDGFATQQLIFDDDTDVPSLESSVIVPSGTSVHVEPVVQTVQNKVAGSQGKVLCRNLFSEWEMRAEAAAVKQNRNPKPVKTSTVTSSGNSPRTPKKKVNLEQSQRDLSEVASDSVVSEKDQCVSLTSLSQSTPSKHDMASSFVPVCSPRLIATDLPKVPTNGACKFEESHVLDAKSKHLDHVKGSQFQTSDTPDSINIEVNSHFRPIRSAPRTPPKQLPDGSFLPEPKLVKSTPTRLAPAPGLLSSLFQRDNGSQPTGARHSSTSTFSEDSEGSAPSSVVTSNQIFSPPPPALVHYAFRGVSPNGYSSDTQEDTIDGRITGPPPELEAYGDVPNNDLDKERRISEMMYRQVQAYQLEQFRKRKLQEDNDREYAEKLQREMNKNGPKIVRTRGSTERYSIRNWDAPSQPSSSQLTPSCSVPGKKYSLRTTRTRKPVDKSPVKPSTPARKGKPARPTVSASKASPRRSTAVRGRPRLRRRSGRK